MHLPANSTRYRGRFAPSPTGPLHFGSLIAAVGSYLQARSCGGEWLVRMEDVDTPRTVPGADREILELLTAYGMSWDGPVTYQSPREPVYQAALHTLLEENRAYPCACSRKDFPGPVYPGTCRKGLPPEREARSVRVRTNKASIHFQDRLQGNFLQHLEKDVGDFILRRADGLTAYQLAVVVDDAEQGITEVVRGNDLLDSTPRQIHLQRLLSLPTPDYLHLPIAVNKEGNKLSKQTFAEPLNPEEPTPALRKALAFLGQEPSPPSVDGNLELLWNWAIDHWDLARIPKEISITV